MNFLNLQKINSAIKTSLVNPILKNMAIVAITTFLIKALAFYKETIIAGQFGLSEILDTFLIAILIPSFIQSVFLNSLRNLFIPNYIAEIKSNGNKSGFQSIIFIMTITISLISIIITYFFIDFFLEIIYPNHDENYYTLIKEQLFIILPCLTIWGISTVISGLLEIEDKFFISTLHQFFPLITMILFLFLFKKNLGNMLLAYGTLAGNIIGLLFLTSYALKYKIISLSKPIINRNIKLMINQLPPKISSSFLSALNNFIDQFFAGSLIVGSIAALNYGNRVPAFGVTIVIMALGSVLLPHFSRLVNEDQKTAFEYLFKILKLVLIYGLITIFILIISSEWIIKLWLESNEFTHEDTLKVSLIQQILFINVPFYLCTLIMVKFLTSINKNKFMAWISLFNLIINIILNIILIKYYGVFGLALSTSFVLILSSCFYFRYTYKLYKKII